MSEDESEDATNLCELYLLGVLPTEMFLKLMLQQLAEEEDV